MKKIFIIIFIIFSVFCFYKIWEINYKKTKEIKQFIVDKPNFLPSKSSALNSSFWFKNLKADYYWLQLIQYIWWNAISSSYKPYLFSMTDLISELNPYFDEPYIVWILLLPNYNKYYENLTEEEIEIFQNQAIKIWEKWVKNFCDAEKIKLIEKEENLENLFYDEKFKNPCKEGSIVYNLAFVYYHYLKDFENAVKYYKVASVTDWVPPWAKNLISILKWKWWDREKSFFMFLNMANYSAKDNQICLDFSNILQDFWKNIFTEKISLNWNFLKEIEKARSENIFDNWEWLSASNCENYLNKAIRELNLYYLEKANLKYKENFWKNSEFPSDLLNSWFIDYIPTDYQQEKDYGIIYFFNEEIWVYDYRMWRYE